MACAIAALIGVGCAKGQSIAETDIVRLNPMLPATLDASTDSVAADSGLPEAPPTSMGDGGQQAPMMMTPREDAGVTPPPELDAGSDGG